ncbi:branched-chain amino acid ABC transporter substrate-binding protein [Geothermobacter hydrogeniphilus]|uniref:Branched-chain amino acid ABC transporter substrate-binding protein n=1 Tax=Geothermobacter hydrogeniphilus TaxID=1969733 RepID=A0A2K2H925_9BACT|nr:branched-chain amino acid ABC transporter substrate-binding protein [Geothermobacter hydrogeniphilus]PNU19733.1 branched-chain amino acid ABC transporter substrate-binding protein [Geothermobacter hydrogeniphilus]
MHKLSKLMLAAAAFCLVAAPALADTLKVGVQAPITGSYANEGQGIENGVRLLAEQINAKGGVLGKKIEVIVCDDQGTAMAAAICAKDLVNQGVKMVIGSYTSTCAEAAQKTYFNAGVLQTSDGTADSLTAKGYWTFLRNSFPNSAEAEFAANYMVNVKKYKRIVVLSDFSTYADGLANATEAAIKKLGGNVVSRDKIKADSQNFTPVLTSIKAKNPDVIFFAGYYSDGGQIRSQQVALGIKADFIGGDANDNPDFVKLAGSAAKGAYIINVPSPDVLPYDIAKSFIADYQKKYGMMPASIWGLMNIDGMRAIIHAMEANKSFDTRKAADYLHNLKEPLPGITGPIAFAKDGNRKGGSYVVKMVKADGSYSYEYVK